MWKPTLPLMLLAGLLCTHHAFAQEASIDARMMRFPDVSENEIAFVYAGDIWVAPKTGGNASRLSSPRGEESFPRFSPDGKTIAFSGNYDGNTDLYTMPVNGGMPRRITHHGAPDRMIGWHPDGKSLIFASSRTSEKDRFNKLFKVSAEGGLPEQLPVPYGEFGAISENGQLLAYITINVDNRTWKRYRGGMNPDIWLFDLKNLASRNLTQNDATDSAPMWHGQTLFFLSDRDPNQRNNIWSIDTRTGVTRQVTFFKDYDVAFPSIGPKDIVFACGDRLYLLDLATLQSKPVEVKVITDQSTLKPRLENVSGYIHGYDISPGGKRAVFEARGDVYTVPQEYGIVRNITRSGGVAERYPTWSPDGKNIAYFSDRTGEYELTLRNEDGSGAETVLTKLGAGYRYRPQWSPDSKKIAFMDQAMRLHLHDLEKKVTTVIDKNMWLYHPELERFTVSWSPDSRWLAYTADQQRSRTAIVIFDSKEGKRHQVTEGFYDDDMPVFDPSGKYLFFRSGRTFSPVYSDLDNSWVYPNTRNLLIVPLRKDIPSPLAPRNDEEVKKDEAKDADKKDGEKKDEPVKADEKKPDAIEAKDGERKGEDGGKADGKEGKDAKPSSKKEDKVKPVEIDFADFERRAVVLPVKAGNYSDLAAVSGKLIYRWHGRSGADTGSPIEFYDLEKREAKRIVDDADDYVLAAKGEKMLIRKGSGYSIIDVKEGQNLNKKLATGGFEMTIDPRAEWKQLFSDAWRIERDFFYDPGLHGVNWEAMRTHYGRLLDQCVTRWDVSFVIGELIAELNASHAYRSGGDTERAGEMNVGYLGCDYALTNGAYQVVKVYDGSAWDSEVRSPLLRPGVTNFKAGDYLLAVNGEPMDTTKDPWAAFQGMADRTVLLTFNDKPVLEGARYALVQTLGSEARLRHLAWIDANRRRVAEASGGQIGYIYVPNTGTDGQSELVRQYSGQFNKPGLIIDERFNSGGQIPDRFVELLSRRIVNYYGVRDGKDWPWPPSAHNGPKAMLMNSWSGSGGDCFPFLFKRAGLGPLIGTRTWGGLIGITGTPGLMDNGSVTAPTFGIYDTDGKWIIEGFGVEPDIEVVDDPAEFARGRDPQLERAIDEVMKSLRNNPPVEVKKPKYPNRAGKVNGN